MSIVDHLKRQISIVSNPNHREVLGGFHLNFVGVGRRKLSFSGWWPSQFDFYVIDAANISQRVRIAKGKREFVRSPNTVLLYGPNTLYEEECGGPLDFDDAWVIFRSSRKFDALHSLVRREGFCMFRDDAGLVRRNIEETAKIADVDIGRRWVASAAFLKILALLHHALPSTEDHNMRVIRPVTGRRPEDRSKFQEEVLRILNKNISRNLSVEELARELGVSRSTLTHRFSSEMGETLAALKNRLRIEKAQEWLDSTDKSLKEIAYELGFNDPTYLSRVFRRRVGFSPSEYRNLIENTGPPGSG